jgi:hypothetical protein
MLAVQHKKMFSSPLVTGTVALILSFIAACILWPIWSLISQSIYMSIAEVGMSVASGDQQHHLLKAFAEGTFFWMIINSWIWLSIVLGTFGKTTFTTKQPVAGLYYTLVSCALGIVAFLILISLPGIWWYPFSLSIMFTPQSVEEVNIAIEAWETSNFFALAVIITQIPLIALFHKWPFTKKVENLSDHLSVLLLGIAITWMVWMALIVPSLMHLTINGHDVFNKPFGNWPAFVAFCQAYVIFAIMPVEGAEMYPMKFFAKKQPRMGIIGFIIALIGGFALPPLIRGIIEPYNLVPGLPVDVLVASLELSIIVFMLAWHHLFDDYPNKELVQNDALRIWCRIAIWCVGGVIFGVIWLKTYHLLPFGSNDIGMGVSSLGVLAGQFALLMCILLCNTFFDKWPLNRQ